MRRLDIPMIHWLTDWLLEDPSKLIALIGFLLSIFTLIRTTWDRMKEQASKFGVSWVRLDLAKEGEEKAPKISLVSPEVLRRHYRRDAARPDSASDGGREFVDTMIYGMPYVDPERYVTGMMMVNDSGAPLYDIHIEAHEYKMVDGQRTPDPSDVILDQPFLPAGKYIAMRLDDNLRYKSTGSAAFAYPEQIKSFAAKIRPIGNSPLGKARKSWFIDEFSFTDAQGRRWKRRAQGKLRRSFFSSRRRWPTSLVEVSKLLGVLAAPCRRNDGLV